MKVCSDACVFGAYMNPGTAQRILDIGTGTGLLSLMLAQRTDAWIEAVEMDDGAAEQARNNFAASSFSDRLTVHHTRIQDFAGGTDRPQYDMICCNPPFFENCLRSTQRERRMARHTDTLSFAELAHAVQQLLALSGRFYVHVPIDFEQSFVVAAQQFGFYVNERVTLRHSRVKPITRVMMCLSFESGPVREEALVLRTEDGTAYAEPVFTMLQPYYPSLPPFEPYVETIASSV